MFVLSIIYYAQNRNNFYARYICTGLVQFVRLNYTTTNYVSNREFPSSYTYTRMVWVCTLDITSYLQYKQTSTSSCGVTTKIYCHAFDQVITQSLIVI